MSKNIVMIGMPGSGKSTIGVAVAKAIGYHFVDCDLVIQNQMGKLLYQLIDERGPEGFLDLEDEINAAIDVERSVIATGGSAVYGANAMKHLRETGMVLYLRLSYPSVCDRLGNFENRGVVLKEGQSFLDAYTERCALYEHCADVTVECDDLTIQETITAVVNAIKPFLGE